MPLKTRRLMKNNNSQPPPSEKLREEETPPGGTSLGVPFRASEKFHHCLGQGFIRGTGRGKPPGNDCH